MNREIDNHQELLDLLGMDEETFAMLDLHNPKILEGLLEQEFGAGMIRYVSAEELAKEDEDTDGGQI